MRTSKATNVLNTHRTFVVHLFLHVISDVAYLEKTFTVPASIDAGQIPLNEVVKSNKHVVHRGQAHLFVDAEITCQSNIKSPVNQIILFVMREHIS